MKGTAKAKADGRRVRAVERKTDRRGRPVFKLSADEVCEIIREHVRAMLGDKVENKSRIYAFPGFFHVKLPVASGVVNSKVRDQYWRKALQEGLNMRRPSLGLLFRALTGEILTGV